MDLRIIEEYGKSTFSTAVNNRPTRKITSVREEGGLRKSKNKSDSQKGDICFVTISVKMYA